MKLEYLGLREEMYDDLMTSGELTYRFLCDGEKTREESFYFLGPDRDTSIFMGIDRLRCVGDLRDADFILNTGTREYDETIEDYEDVLRCGLEYGLPMLCANPDQVVVVGCRNVICAGMLARIYGEMGGSVLFWGKPYREIYEWSLLRAGVRERGRVLAVGDNLRTDIRGAMMMGFASIFLPLGIHRGEVGCGDDEGILGFCEGLGIMPSYMMEGLWW